MKNFLTLLLVLQLALAACRQAASPPAAEMTSTRPATTAAPTATAPTDTAPASNTEAPIAITPPATTTHPAAPAETAVTTIPLAGPLSDADAEVSAMAWYGDTLILVPQYPHFNGRGNGDGFVYVLGRAEIEAFLDGQTAGPLEPQPIPFAAPGLANSIPGFEGYEALAFAGDTAYLTIEASPAGGMVGYLVSGTLAPDLSALTLDTEQVVTIPRQGELPNKSDEALLIVEDTVLTLYEANGAAVNPEPVAYVFDPALQPVGTLPFPNIEFRITDATELDENDHFWAINYFFPGEPEMAAQVDPLAVQYGEGPTHALQEGVERLVEFQYTPEGITITDTPPVQLELLPTDLRNWEGIVRLQGRGFLLVTDKFPETILGFVPWSQ